MQLTYETEHLLLSIGNEKFADLIAAYLLRNREDFTRWDRQLDENTFTREYQLRAVQAEIRLFMKSEGMRYYVFLKDDPNRVIGNITFSLVKNGNTKACEIGYKADKAERGKGYTFEAASFLIPLIIEEYRPSEIFAEILPENRPALAFVQKLGFRYDSIKRNVLKLDGLNRDALRYVLPVTD